MRKKFWLQPKWKILRIYTKTLPRKKVEDLRDSLSVSYANEKDEMKKAYLKGKLKIIKLLLDEE